MSAISAGSKAEIREEGGAGDGRAKEEDEIGAGDGR